MGFLSFKTDDTQRELNSQAFLHAFTAGAEASRQKASEEASAKIATEKEAAENARFVAGKAIEAAKAKADQAAKLDEWARGKTYDHLKDIVNDAQARTKSQDLTAEDRNKAASTVQAANILQGMVLDPNYQFDPHTYAKLDLGVEAYTPDAIAAHKGAQRTVIANSANAVKEGRLKDLEITLKQNEVSGTGPGSKSSGEKVNGDYIKAIAGLQDTRSTIKNLTDTLNLKNAELASLTDTNGRPTDAVRYKDALTQSNLAQAALNTAKNNLRGYYAQANTMGLLGLGGPDIQKALQNIAGKGQDIYNIDQLPGMIDHVNGALQPALDAMQNGKPLPDDDAFTGYGKLGSLIGALPGQKTLLDDYNYTGVDQKPPVNPIADIKDSGKGTEVTDDQTREAFHRRYPGLVYPDDSKKMLNNQPWLKLGGPPASTPYMPTPSH